MQSTLESTLKQISSLLAGDLNCDQVAEAKQLLNQLLDSPEWRISNHVIIRNGKNLKSAAQTKKNMNKQEDLNNQIDHSLIKDNSFLVVKVGDQDRPACLADIEQVRDIFTEALRNKFPDLPIIVTHHAMDVELHTTAENVRMLAEVTA